MQIVEPSEWVALRDSLPQVPFLFDPLIPAHGVTLVHGPPECGKSAWTWGVGNAISTGEPYLGIPTAQTKVLLLSNDMNIHEFKMRWGTAFVPRFAFLATPKFNCTVPKFEASPMYKLVKAYIEANQVGLVLIDALGGVHAGKSAKDDETATLVDMALAKWLAPAAVLLVAHDRKARTDKDGTPLTPTTEDFLGTQLWRANATSQVHMWKANNHVSILHHAKSQVAVKLPHQLKLYIDLHGMAELWDEHRANEVTARFTKAIKELGLQGETTTVQVEAVAQHCEVSVRTAWRWKSLSEV